MWTGRKNGETYPVWQSISTVRDQASSITNQVAGFSDITLLKKSEEQLAHMAHHDTLTGLANRFSFIANLEQSLERAKRHKFSVALLFVDLDRFKAINDTRGHHIGDGVLKEIACRMKGCVRAEDTVARLGGDEFIILLSEVAVPEDAAKMAEIIVNVIRRPIRCENITLRISASVGVSLYPEDAQESEYLLKAADMAMYQAKESGKDKFHFFTQELAASADRYTALERDLQSALESNEFELYYQPQIRLSDHHIVGLEALIRWNHPVHGLLQPEEFIHIADDSDLIDSITQWAIYTAINEHSVWSENGTNGLRIAVNITGRQFNRERSIIKIIDVLDRLAPELKELKLDLEITETAFDHVSKVVEVIDSLRDHNVVFSIDDFGTGHSSLSRLKQIPVESIKIDQSFIRDITIKDNDKAIVRAIISMGHSLGLRVIGEGVENDTQLTALEELGCDEVQGYFISYPLPSDEITDLLKN
jgi:diguanylate cyclase (GGDEF)-like protein